MKQEDTPTRPDNSQPANAGEEIISLSEIARMILRHRLKIALFTILATTFSAAVFFLSPRQYTAEGLLQIIPPVTVVDDKIDRDLFETTIISRLQTIQSAFIAKDVCADLNATGGVAMTISELQGRVKINRPPKSNLLVITASSSSPAQAITIIKLWINKYLASIRKNNINVALSQVRSMLRKVQSGLMEAQAKTEELKTLAAQTHPVVDLSRGIDNTQLWQELSANVPAEKLKSLSQIHIKGQEQNTEYLALKTMVYNAAQISAAAEANRNFLQEVENYLEIKDRQIETPSVTAPPASSNAVQFAENMLKMTDVIEMGEPALKSSSRNALKKTVVVFFVSLLAASFCAYLAEWFKTIKI